MTRHPRRRPPRGSYLTTSTGPARSFCRGGAPGRVAEDRGGRAGINPRTGRPDTVKVRARAHARRDVLRDWALLGLRAACWPPDREAAAAVIGSGGGRRRG